MALCLTCVDPVVFHCGRGPLVQLRCKTRSTPPNLAAVASSGCRLNTNGLYRAWKVSLPQRIGCERPLLGSIPGSFGDKALPD